tara:strand:+ start:7991 stop:8737 length:747 start_codon:yes stop_codon:yes gene_type:complete
MSTFQDEFARALLNPDLATPAGLIDPSGRVAGKRFDVYRNNVVHSLIAAMGESFPAIKKIVGDDFFDAVAGVYIRAHPPQQPVMMFYGQDFPAFLLDFEPVAHLNYLSDVARLELVRRDCYNAADINPMDAMVLTTMSPDALMSARVTFVPCAVLFHTCHSAHSIWHYNMVEEFQITDPQEWILLTRPELDIIPHHLDEATFAVLEALKNGDTLETAFDAGLSINSDFDLSGAIGLMMSTQIIQNITS